MPWSTPTLAEVRGLVRDAIRAKLPGADAMIANSVLRVMSDSQGALCHANLQYLDWLAKQLLPDTAEHDFLDRHGKIWLVDADGSTGRKSATLASGTVTFAGTPGTVIPLAQQLVSGSVFYETTTVIEIGVDVTSGPVRALDPGTAGNLVAGSSLDLVNAPTGAGTATVVEMTGGTDDETDEELRVRVLLRIRQPPMGGDQNDYVQWALAYPGVTRAWCGAKEQGIGTVTVRFMMDDLRADRGGFPAAADCQQVAAYLDTVRPVTVKDFYVVSPIPQPIDIFIQALKPDSATTRAMIETSLQTMLLQSASPGQTIFAAWKYYAIMGTSGVDSFDILNAIDDVMPSPGHMATLGDIVYGVGPTSP